MNRGPTIAIAPAGQVRHPALPASGRLPQRPTPGGHVGFPSPATLLAFLGLVLGHLALPVPAFAQPDPGPGNLRFAFSSSMFTEVNENDAKASVKAWALAIARERGVHVEAHPVLLNGTNQITEAVAGSLIDGAALTTPEFLALPPHLQGTNLLLSYNEGSYTETYVLLVRADSALADLPALAGRRLVVFDNPRASLALPWLEVTLAGLGLPPASRHFSQLQKAAKLPKVVLPVFFKQQDACLVTERGFRIMCELNPQVRARTRVLATSPSVVPVVSFLRPAYQTIHTQALMKAILSLNESSAGGQVLTLFQSGSIHEGPIDLLLPSRHLIEAYQRLASTNAAHVETPPRPSSTPRS